MQSENTAQTDDTVTPDSDAAPIVKLETLTALLEDKPAADTTPDGDENGAAAGDGDKDAKPKLEMFNDLAESLGIELNDLYALKVSTVDGKTVTIEEMKALQATQDEIAIRELEFEETRAAKEGNLRQAQNELAEIVAALPNGTIKPEVLEKLRVKNAARVEIEQTRTIDAIPGWSDEKIRTQEMLGMTTHLERFGFPANHLETVIDHRMYVFIRESYLREQRIRNALAKVRAGKPNPTTPTKTAAQVKTTPKRKDSNARNGLESFLMDA